ncbi:MULTISPECIES: glycosyltransferase [Tsukamurella]|uniref:Glycosyltransferase family 1 protein n=2 Tax=Tsukamurella TaxID=2060 RepID=A0A5C5S154_9ACTN|nr:MULTISPECIES: glycosyltransferase [Tsukamurella]NMD54472.1 glycosyltransferase family 1 protein [Tsukamurella columbiensis]TWS28398.1 glycosyltransferase family 1 protein [Tsukamurella conjunctivitidis]
MNILLTGIAGYSHLVPFVLPAASALRAAGHRVTIAVPEAGVDLVAEYGFEALPLRGVPELREVVTDPALRADDFSVAGYVPPASLPPIDGALPTSSVLISARAFIGVIAHRAATALLDALGDSVPDLILRDNTEFGGHLVAERLGCREAVLDVAPMLDERAPELVAILNEVRREHDLPVVTALPVAPRIAQTPLDFYPPERPVGDVHCFRPGTRTHAPLDAAIADLPADGPLVLASLGSVAPRIGIGGVLLDRIVEALGSLEVRAVVAAGSHAVPNPPTNVIVTDFADQQTVLSTCDAFVSHGGFNGVRESLQAGVPTVLLPLFGDHPGNAAQVERLGAGIALDPATASAEEIAAATAKILADPAYRRNAQRFARRTQALPELGAFPAVLA